MGEYYVTIKHEMGKNHYISFMAYSTSNDTQFIKMYPEQNAEGRFAKAAMEFCMLTVTCMDYFR